MNNKGQFALIDGKTTYIFTLADFIQKGLKKKSIHPGRGGYGGYNDSMTSA